ncbi:hypothetical protein BDM02DRAFT_3190699 [Thelephora ganbajun]|uniref:Uncharacterized protein n=1 Tax=Thelephora ganbajun TaxID=370292 RepID=A0ACB6Z3K6_THEGA|nr:hypothetical protein BDM02DRAFT_3190699 [Thelephora ganbajun]
MTSTYLQVIFPIRDNVMNILDLIYTAFSQCFTELRGIWGTREILPKLATIPDDLLSTGDLPFTSGALAAMHEGSLNGSKVCVGKVRLYSNGDPQKMKKARYPSLSFSSSDPPKLLLPTDNIVLFLGAAIDSPQLVSVWMPDGSLTEWINEHQGKVDSLSNMMSPRV